ncbi:MAG: 2-hydroxyacyl-CoA dehydratase family protein [Planctomycetaceae bacterium]|nr:2-hydroxyacyl-CoA dehydratase family protein [Planctomycetaceae bacterium]
MDCSGKSAGLSRFDRMLENCCQYAVQARQEGKPIVGILCEYTPRELIMAAGAVPVCLCGGSHAMALEGEQDLPVGLCPLIKSTYGYCRAKKNPLLEMADLVVAETTCDGKKKMYELMARRKAMYVLELPQKPDDADAQTHWLRELRKFKEFLESRYTESITDDALRKAIATMNRERGLRRQLAEMMKQPCPPWTGRQLLNYKSIISGIESDLVAYERLTAKARPRAELKDRPRILLTGVPTVHGAEKVVDILENAGGLVVCMENCTGIKPIMEDVDAGAANPLEAIAKKYFYLPCSVMTANRKRIENLRRLTVDYAADCIVDMVWQGCLTYDVESWFVKELADELKLPYLKIVTDYGPSDAERIALRVEALLETAAKTR